MARMTEEGKVYEVFMGKPEREHANDRGVGGR
jgi:hypothetical protein